jgi:DNA-binding Xre family transcriptional regulator
MRQLFDIITINRIGDDEMITLHDLIRIELFRQYGSLRQFSSRTGIPLSTVNCLIMHGINYCSFNTVVTVCNALSIQPIDLYQDEGKLLDRLELLDTKGLRAVNAIFKMIKDETFNI